MIHVKLVLPLTKDQPDLHLWVDPMPLVPRQGDLIDPRAMITDRLRGAITKEQYELMREYAWQVSFVCWSKDSYGYFAEVWCEGG